MFNVLLTMLNIANIDVNIDVLHTGTFKIPTCHYLLLKVKTRFNLKIDQNKTQLKLSHII